MKSLRFSTVCLRTALALGCLAILAGAHAANTKPNAKPGSTTNSVSLEVTIPQSTFDYAGKGAKDPFFPLSTRAPHILNQATNSEPTISAVTFKLKGLSGSSGSLLALINNRTVAIGESAEVTTPVGKLKIHCLEIRKFSVVIRVEGQLDPIEVFLPKNDR